MKIAQFKTGPGISSTTIIDQRGGEGCIQYCGWVRISEYVEVDFQPLPADVVVEGQLKQIDAAEQELREKFQQKLNELTEARAKLQALTHEKQS